MNGITSRRCRREGITLRQAGINAPIVILGPVFYQQFTDLFTHQLTPVISDASILPALGQAASSLPTPYPIHLKVETGMGRLRLGHAELLDLFSSRKFPHALHLEGLMTHLADADGPATDTTEEQLTRFRKAIEIVRASGFRVPLIHAANRAGAVRFPDVQFSVVRPGIMLYGYHTLPASIAAPDLKPVLTLRTTIAQLRTVQAGHKVSYNRHLHRQDANQDCVPPHRLPYVEDVAEACVRAIEVPDAVGQAFNVAHVEGLTQRTFVMALARVAGIEPTLVSEPRRVNAATGGKLVGDRLYFGEYLDMPSHTEVVEKAPRLLGVNPTSFETALRAGFAWYTVQPRRTRDYSFEDRLIAQA